MESKPSSVPLLIFFGLLGLSIYTALLSNSILMGAGRYDIEFDFRNSLSFLSFCFCYLVICYRLMFVVMTFDPGVIEIGSAREIPFHTKALFELYIFMPITLSRLVPMPLTRILYKALGAKIGQGSYPGNGSLMDYPFCTIGSNVIFAQASIVSPHILRDGRYEIQPIEISDRATIGPGTVIYGGSKIGEQSLVLANSSVRPGTEIGNREIWGGNPAKFIKSFSSNQEAQSPTSKTAEDHGSSECLDLRFIGEPETRLVEDSLLDRSS